MASKPHRTRKHNVGGPAATIWLFTIIALLLTTLPPGAATAAAATTGYAASVLGTAGLQSYWRLDERTGTTAADSKGTVSGTYAGAVTLGAPGALASDTDTAVSFDGSSGAVNFGISYGFGGTHAFSVEFWLRATTVPVNGYTKLVWKEDTAGSRTGWGTYLNDDGSTRSVALERYNAGKWLGGVTCSGLTLNTAYHVVFTYDGKTARCYLNGSLGASAAGGGSVTASTRSLVLSASDTNNSYYSGMLDEVALYNVALTGVQVQTHYAAGTTNAPTTTPNATATSTPPPAVTSTPTTAPTSTPTTIATSTPTTAPTSLPTSTPTTAPTITPTIAPTSTPTTAPTSTPTSMPTSTATASPSKTATPNASATPTSTSVAANVTISIDRTVQVGVSQLATGVTHTQYSLDPWGNATAIGAAQQLLQTSTTYQNEHLMGWGSTNPEPSPGVYDWSSLDQRIGLMRQTGGTPVITLCCAPDWMKGGTAGTTDWSKLEVAPTPDHYADFAALARQVALRYPDVKYFQVWNEMKGFWNGARNRWDYEGYTQLYNQVYDAVKSVNPTIQVGGPYVVIRGTPGNYDQRNFDVITYWLANKHGGDFIAVDSGDNSEMVNDPIGYLQKFQDVATWIRQRSQLPIWWSEWYVSPFSSDTYSHSFQSMLATTALMRMVQSGAAVELRWQPQGVAGSSYQGDQESLWSDTRVSGGGQAFPAYTWNKAIHTNFAPGAVLYRTTSSSPDVEVLASATTTLLVNKRSTSLTVSVNGNVITLAGYEVRLI